MKISSSLFSAVLLALAFSAPFALAAPVPISTIQGDGPASPFVNENVTVQGVVTGDFSGPTRFDGFFIQDPIGDGNPATSEGLFVYVPARSKFADFAVKPGDRVQISGRVSQYKGQTQVSSPTEIKLLGRGEPLQPQLVKLTADMKWESLENMLVRFDETLVVTAQNDLQRYGTIKLSASRLFNPTNGRTIEEVTADPQPAVSIDLDDGSGDSYPKDNPFFDADNTRRTGSTIAGLTGIVTEYDGAFRIEPTVRPDIRDANPRPLLPPVVGGTLKVAGANVLNYWTTFKNKENPNARGAEGPTQFERQSAKTMAAMKGLDGDVLGIMELENNPVTVAEFTSRLNEVYGREEYAAIVDPDGGVGEDAIRVGLFYKPGKVEPVGPARTMADRIFDRQPLAQTFRDKATGGVFTVIVNHFKSKGSGPKTGDVDLGEGAWNLKRTQQAKRLVEFIDTMIMESRDPDVLTFGDFNAYGQEAPIRLMRDAGLKHLNLRLPPEDRYSFSYDGLFGSLDHALATPHLDAQITGFGEWHINADEPFFNVYNRLRVADFVADPYRSSDHDPFVIGLNLTVE